MLKKLLSLFGATCILFGLSACTESKDTTSAIQAITTQEINQTTTTNGQSTQNLTDSETTATSTTTTPTTTSTTTPTTITSTTTTTTTQSTVNTTLPTTHTHSYSNATCTSPGKCSCGVTTGSALGHLFSSATCTVPATCSRCGATEGSLAEHKYEGGICSSCGTIDEPKYVEACGNAAEKVFTDYTKYKDALKIIKEALQKFPNNDTLKTKRDHYQSFAPLYLSDIEPYVKSTWFKQLDDDTDVFNTTHYHCIRIAKNFRGADGTYDLSAKYNTFNATVYGLGDGISGLLKIYADGVCIYSNTSISPTTRPFKITLDITGVMDLKFEMGQQYQSYTGECFGLSDVYIQKTVK